MMVRGTFNLTDRT